MLTEIRMNAATGEIEEIELPALSLDETKTAKVAAINTLRDRAFREGFTVSNTGTALDGHVLQTRDIEDRTNWLTSQAAYAAAVTGGFGAAPGATFRTAANATVTLTFMQGMNVLLAMADWGKQIMGNSWALKDAIDAAEDGDALDAIDIGAGWP